MILTFPSTFKAEFRVLKGAEISEMANRPDVSSSESIGHLLRSTWVKTVDPGPYAWESGGDGKPSVLGADGALLAAPQCDKMLSGDLIFGLLWHAIESVPRGELYKFPVQCERTHPKRQYDWSINLKSQLLERGDEFGGSAVRYLSHETVEHMRARGNRFETTVAGRKAVYKLQSPSDERPIADLRKIVKKFTPAEIVAVQLIEIEGIGKSVRDRWEFTKNLDGPDLYTLFEEVQGKDCGIETGISTRCPECEWEQEVDLPFGRLFSPRRH